MSKTPKSVLLRLERAVNRYHCGPGKYGRRYLLTCLRLCGLRVVQAKRTERKARK